jgi:membrane protein
VPAPTAVDRVAEEGASPALVKWVGRTAAWVPGAAPTVGFWATVYARFARHRGSVLAGGLAFFGLLSLVPSLLSLGAVVALLYSPAEFAEDVRELVADRPEALASLGPLLDSIATLSDTTPTTIGLAGLASLLISLYAASRFVYVGRQVLDIGFELEPQPPSVLSRGIAILVTLAIQVGVVVVVIGLTLIPRLLELIGITEAWGGIVRVVRAPLALLLGYALLTMAMRFGTRARGVVPWLNLGAALGTLLMLGGTLGLGWYLSVSITYSQIVAILGGVIALELWLYLVGLAIVLSAEIEGVRLGFRRRDLD